MADDYRELEARLNAIKSDCENTDGWEAAGEDIGNAADAIAALRERAERAEMLVSLSADRVRAINDVLFPNAKPKQERTD